MNCNKCKYFKKKYMDGDADGFCKHLKEETNTDSHCRMYRQRKQM